jgi:hypothetical protein
LVVIESMPLKEGNQMHTILAPRPGMKKAKPPSEARPPVASTSSDVPTE